MSSQNGLEGTPLHKVLAIEFIECLLVCSVLKQVKLELTSTKHLHCKLADIDAYNSKRIPTFQSLRFWSRKHLDK